MSSTIELYYYTDKKGAPSLYEIRFTHPLLSEKRVSFRGKGDTSPTGYSFQQTPALEALVELLVKTKAEGKSPTVSGGRGTPASSLDYALSKVPQWLEDVFGTTKKGQPIIKRLVRRSNTECRRPGPVILWLQGDLRADAIRFFVDGQEVSCLYREAVF